MPPGNWPPPRNLTVAMQPMFRRGLTLLELVVVIAILAIIAGFVIPLAGGRITKSKVTATNANLVLIRNAIMGAADSPGVL